MTAPPDRDPDTPSPPGTGSNGASELDPTAGQGLAQVQATNAEAGPSTAPGAGAEQPLAGVAAGMGQPPADEVAQDPPKRQWGWIAACAVLAVAVVVLAIWGFGKHADVTHANEETAQAQQQAAQAQQQADQASQQVDDLSSQFDQLTQNVSDAGAAAKQKFQAALDGLKGSLASLKDKLSQIEPPATSTPAPSATAVQPTATPAATVAAPAAPAATSTAVENATPGSGG